MTSKRKDEHVALADAQRRAPGNDFDDVRFVHHALAGISRNRVDLKTEFAGIRWRAPLYINGMTGGSARTGEINRALAIAAAETGVAVASGSMSICFRDPGTRPSFEVLRSENPNGFVMANLSAGADADTAARAVDLLQADALQLHLNSVQETVMPEGQRDFQDWAAAIAAIVEKVPVPVIVKEVGFGLSARTLRELAELGVRVADVSGSGGTDFARIENERHAGKEYGFLAGWGQSAVCSLLDAGAEEGTGVALLASGGVRTPLDVARALALRAEAVGASGIFLHEVLHGGTDALVTLIRTWLRQLGDLMALLGAARPADLQGTDLLLRGLTREFCELRGIDAGAYSRRSTAPRGPS